VVVGKWIWRGYRWEDAKEKRRRRRATRRRGDREDNEKCEGGREHAEQHVGRRMVTNRQPMLAQRLLVRWHQV
jgi:hypothetical protein